ncbi:MFS transporter [Bifidobacterium breve]|uniref:MFS transporter n=1 Tax=Bifidobacterium breve TaxID=1685 RepID=UPI0006CB4E71|nr:MFS transporter [Bifidobacterium breve]ALE13057.1 Putative transport protein [Bifidobacterium breve]OQM61216.1 transporter [Bifidobacterium breve]
MVAGQPIGTMIGSRMINNAQAGFIIGAVIMLAFGFVALAIWPREESSKDMERTKMTLKDLAVSFHFPKFSTSRDFYKAFGCRVCMLLSYQMISVYHTLHRRGLRAPDQDRGCRHHRHHVHHHHGRFPERFADLRPDLRQDAHARKVLVIIASLLFAIGTAMPWIMPSVTGMYLYAGIAGFGYGVYSAIDQALNVDVLPNKEEAGKDLGILNLATTLGQAVGPTITSTVKTATGALRLHSPSPSSWPCAPPCSCCAFRR